MVSASIGHPARRSRSSTAQTLPWRPRCRRQRPAQPRRAGAKLTTVLARGPGPHRQPHPARARVVRVVAPTGRQHHPVDHRPLPAQCRPRQPHRRRQAQAPAEPSPSRRHTATAPEAPVSGSGQHGGGESRPSTSSIACAGDGAYPRPWRPPSCSTSTCPSAFPLRQCRRPDGAAAGGRPPSGYTDSQLRRPLHRRPPRRLRVPRVPAACTSSCTAARTPGASSAPLRRAGHHHHALRHGRAQPDEPLPPGQGGLWRATARPRGWQDLVACATTGWPSTTSTSGSTWRTSRTSAAGRGVGSTEAAAPGHPPIGGVRTWPDKQPRPASAGRGSCRADTACAVARCRTLRGVVRRLRGSARWRGR